TVPGQGDTETGRQGEEKKELFEIHPSGDTTRAPKVLNNNNLGWSPSRNPRRGRIKAFSAPKGLNQP
ncbi:MAG: hypothetical protein CVT94_12390, partial [Bacteroidetes bacterium HGW-Bacteroidetes-11]